MRLSTIIATARKAGVREIELHPDGSVARLVFAAPPGPEPKPKRERTKEELLKEEQDRRNPRRDALDVALEAMGST